jgi:glutamyl/glutaminyl-tRNA synthetase
MNLAYYDFHTAEELDQMREEKEKNKETPRFHLSITEIAAHYE